jgi:hypothetical protein
MVRPFGEKNKHEQAEGHEAAVFSAEEEGNQTEHELE